MEVTIKISDEQFKAIVSNYPKWRAEYKDDEKFVEEFIKTRCSECCTGELSKCNQVELSALEAKLTVQERIEALKGVVK